jgi:hypothetical protein
MSMSLIAALIVYGGDTDYTLRFQTEKDKFVVDTSLFTLLRDNDSLVAVFPSSKSWKGRIKIKNKISCSQGPANHMHQFL